MYQVHVRESPGRPRRAIAFTLAMICLATGAAALFVRHQESDPSGNRVYPPGWSVSFVPPGGWALVEVDRSRPGPGRLCFTRAARDARPPLLCVSRVVTRGPASARDICADRMATFFPPILGRADADALLRAVEHEKASLGPLQGVRTELEDLGDIFVVGVAERSALRTEAYVLEFHRDGPLAASDKELCATVARSFEVR